jgi:hypothetical protein
VNKGCLFVHPDAKLLELRDNVDQDWEIAGELNGVPIKASPVTGSDVDIVSKAWIDRHGLQVIPGSATTIDLPNNRVVTTAGAIDLFFRFKDDLLTHHRRFQVLSTSVGDVILGRGFLNFTRTLTRFSDRLIKTQCPARQVRRVMSVGPSKHYILGSLAGEPVTAVPDTGSDAMLMSRRYAKSRGFSIRSGKGDRTTLEFADGSRARTMGIVPNLTWKFGTTGQGSQDTSRAYFGEAASNDFNEEASAAPPWSRHHRVEEDTAFLCDFHVLDGLRFDVVLRKDLLLDAQVFQKFPGRIFDRPLTLVKTVEIAFIRKVSKDKYAQAYALPGMTILIDPKPHHYLLLTTLFLLADALRLQRELQAEEEPEIAVQQTRNAENSGSSSSSQQRSVTIEQAVPKTKKSRRRNFRFPSV